jgi:hypothetical protein
MNSGRRKEDAGMRFGEFRCADIAVVAAASDNDSANACIESALQHGVAVVIKAVVGKVRPDINQ